MASPFSVTTTTNGVRLDRERKGEVSFTVYNATGRATRARVRLAADRPEAVPWLTLSGEGERAFAIAGTEQYTVQVVAPSAAAPGSYPFRLEVIGVDRPDTEFVAGPTVTFEVPPQDPPKRRVPAWVPIAAIAGVVVAGAAIYWWSRPEPVVAIPDVRGLAEADARRALEVACAPAPCFEVAVDSRSDAEVAEAAVVTTEPEGSAARGSTVTLVLSTGPERVSVPAVAGMELVAGVRAIYDAGLQVTGEATGRYDASVPEGRLIGSEPAGGEPAPLGSDVGLITSLGPRPGGGGVPPVFDWRLFDGNLVIEAPLRREGNDFLFDLDLREFQGVD